MNPRNVWPVVTLSLGIMVGIGVMAALKVNQQTIMLAVTSGPFLALSALLAAQGAHNAQAVQSVQAQTNGNQAKLLDILERQGELLAAGTPTGAPDAVTLTPGPVSVPSGDPPPTH